MTDNLMKKQLRLPTVKRLMQVLEYNPITGALIWKKKIANFIHIGMVAGTTCSKGYQSIMVDGVRFKSHRASWAMFFGSWPETDIDHINGNPSDNRIVNLRLADRSLNCANRSVFKNSTSGFTGVHFSKKQQKWVAHIVFYGKRENLGSFDTKDDAIAARIAAEIRIAPAAFRQNRTICVVRP